MARRVLFFVLSLVVFASAVSSGIMYYKSADAEKKLQQAHLMQAKFGKTKQDAERKIAREIEARKVLDAKLVKAEKNTREISDANQKLKTELGAIKKKLQSANDENNNLKSSLQAASKESTQAKDSITDAKAGLVKLEKTLANSQAQNKTLTEQLAKQKNNTRQIRKELEEVTKADKEKAQRIKLQDFRLAGAIEEVKSAGKKLATVVRARTDLLLKYNKQTKELAAAQQQLAKAQAQTETAEKQLGEKEQQISSLNKEIAASKSKLAELNQTVLKLQEEKTKLANAAAPPKKEKKAKKEKTKTAARQTKTEKKAPAKKKADNDKKDKPEEPKKSSKAEIVQAELKRLGCYSGKIDGIWGKGSLAALNHFSKSAKLERVRSYPTKQTIALLKSRSGKFCQEKAAATPDKKNDKNKKQMTDALQSSAQNSSAVDSYRKQCLNSCIGAFEDIKSCRERC